MQTYRHSWTLIYLDITLYIPTPSERRRRGNNMKMCTMNIVTYIIMNTYLLGYNHLYLLMKNIMNTGYDLYIPTHEECEYVSVNILSINSNYWMCGMNIAILKIK